MISLVPMLSTFSSEQQAIFHDETYDDGHIVAPDEYDATYCTAIEVSNVACPEGAARQADSIATYIKLQRQLSWRIPRRFMFLFVAREQPLVVDDLVGSSCSNCTLNAIAWARMAGRSLFHHLAPLGFELEEIDRHLTLTAPARRSFFLLVSFDEALHRAAEPEVLRLLHEPEWGLQLVESPIRFEIPTQLEAGTDALRTALGQTCPLTECSPTCNEFLDLAWQRISQIESDLDDFSSYEMLSRLGINNDSILKAASLADFLGDGAPSAMQLLTQYVQHIWDEAIGLTSTVRPLLGNSRQAHASIPQLVSGNEIRVIAFDLARHLKLEGSREEVRQQLLSFETDVFHPPAPGHLRLYRGCTLQWATTFFEAGSMADLPRFEPRTDFGPAIYTTPLLGCALMYALPSAVPVTATPVAIIALDIPLDREWEHLHKLTLSFGDEWQRIVQAFRGDSGFSSGTFGRWGSSSIIIGPLTANATACEIRGPGHEEPRPLRLADGTEVLQYAFRNIEPDPMDFLLSVRYLCQVWRFDPEPLVKSAALRSFSTQQYIL